MFAAYDGVFARRVELEHDPHHVGLVLGDADIRDSAAGHFVIQARGDTERRALHVDHDALAGIEGKIDEIDIAINRNDDIGPAGSRYDAQRRNGVRRLTVPDCRRRSAA